MMCSVIIPAYNASTTLAECLEAVLDQGMPKDEYEVIVVDDGSTDDTATVAGRHPVRLLRQRNSGPAVARNLGAGEARGEVLVFTDSDCVPDREFLRNILAPFADPEVKGAQGSYRTRQGAFVARFCQAEIEARYKKMSRDSYIDFIGSYAAAYRRKEFLSCGGFDPGFIAASGEDTDLSYKMSERGHKMVFCPTAFVYHRHPATLKKYLRTKFYRGYWRVRLYTKHPKKAVKDSYTPQSLKLQVLSFPVFVSTAAASFMDASLALIPSAIFLSFIFSSAPLNAALRPGRLSERLMVPLVLFLSGASLFLGLASGLMASLREKRFKPG